MHCTESPHRNHAPEDLVRNPSFFHDNGLLFARRVFHFRARISSDCKVLDRILAALVETAKAVAAQQRRLDESEATSKIDGRKDVEELLERTAHRVPVEAPSGGLDRARSGQGDSVGEASDGDYRLHRNIRRSRSETAAAQVHMVGYPVAARC